MTEGIDEQLMLLFYVGENLYSCSTVSVMEVIPKVNLQPLTHAPDYFSGLLNLSGTPVPVIDFSKLVANRPSSSSMHSRIILFSTLDKEEETPSFGLIAEKVTETSLLPTSAFVTPQIPIGDFPFLGGILNTESETVQMVLVEELFKRLKHIEVPHE